MDCTLFLTYHNSTVTVLQWTAAFTFHYDGLMTFIVQFAIVIIWFFSKTSQFLTRLLPDFQAENYL
jgi:hypothetical protein